MPDEALRAAAFQFLEEQVELAGDSGALSRRTLSAGFMFHGDRVPLVGPQGIFKPRVAALPLSITSTAVVAGEDRPYDDGFGPDGLLRYHYRGSNPNHHENVGLRVAMQRRVPLVYFHGLVPGLYAAAWPVYIVGDDLQSRTFSVSVDERSFVSLGNAVQEEETPIRRRYVTAQVRRRLHQATFRERVVQAYQHHCAVCRLKRGELLEAAHIMPDSNPLGEPKVSNGVALCNLHHAAFDRHLIGFRPDRIVEVRKDVMEDSDGPMLVHGLQGFHGKRLSVPSNENLQPDPQLLLARYELFRGAAPS